MTSDGSTTILNPDLEETYHSVHGATIEAEHVYITNGLEYFLNSASTPEARIFEVGFGTGLNACLSYQYAVSKQVAIRYLRRAQKGKAIKAMLIKSGKIPGLS